MILYDWEKNVNITKKKKIKEKSKKSVDIKK